MRRYLADLHIHTALSPCASPEMTPPVIVREAMRTGLSMIAVCDHNTTGNVAATQEAAGLLVALESARAARVPAGKAVTDAPSEPCELVVLAGMEITTAEEAHVLGIFPDAESGRAAAESVGATLPDRPPTGENFGLQLLLDADGRVRDRERKMLSAASALTLEQAVELIHRHGGLAVAAHADRPSFSVTSQLGLFPRSAGLDAIEISCAGRHKRLAADLTSAGLPMLASSDSHFPGDIGSARTRLSMRRPCFEEFELAVRGVGGRRLSRA